jgi:hypothetical protein
MKGTRVLRGRRWRGALLVAGLMPGLVAGLLALAGGSAAAANLVLNPSFEQVDSAGMPENWATRAWTPNAQTTAGTKAGGKGGARVLTMGVRGGSTIFGCFSRAIDVSALKCRRLLVSCRYKTVAGPYAQFMAVSYKDDFMKLQWQTRPLSTEARALLPSPKWTSCTWHTELKPGTRQLVIMLQLLKEGALFVDDVVVRPAPDEVSWSDLEVGRVAALPGARRVFMRLTNEQPGARKVTVAVTPYEEYKPRAPISKTLTLESGAPQEVDLRYSFPAAQAHQADVTVTDDASHELLLYERVRVPGLVDAWMLEPAFRGTVMTSSQEPQIKLSGRLFAVPAVADVLKVQARHTGTGAEATEGQGIIRQEDDTFSVTLPASGMLVGRHEIHLSAMQGAKSVATADLPVVRAKASAGETYYDAQHRLWMGPRQVFPLAVVNVLDTEDLEPARQAGFNVVFVPSRKASYMLAEAAAPKGLSMVISSPGTVKDFWENMQRKFGDHPAMLGWEVTRRPDANLVHPDVMLALYQVLEGVSPSHPTITTLEFPEAMADYARATDIIIPWELPIPQFPLERVAAMVDAGVGATADRKPVWALVQGVGNAWATDKTLDDQTEGRMPTAAEVRASAYLALVHGASGLVYYALNLAQSDKERNFRAPRDGAEQWAAISQVNREVTSLAPVISQRSGWHLLPPVAGGLVHIARWTTADQDVLIAVSVSDVPTVTTFTVPGVESGELKLPLENRTVTTEQPGLFGDVFQPHEVHIYSTH